MVASDHHQLNYQLNPIAFWCVHVFSVYSEIIPFFVAEA